MLFHLSETKNLNILEPQIPECAIPMYEDIYTERVCFSDSIDGCLSALQDSPNEYYVYVPLKEISQDDIHKPTVYECRDTKYTHEVWMLKPVEVKCIGLIKSFASNFEKRYNSGRGRVTIFRYPYEWIEKDD